MKHCFYVTGFATLVLWVTMSCPARAMEEGTQRPLGTRLKPGEYSWEPAKSPTGAVGIIVDLTNQTLHVYRDGRLIGRSAVSTGTKSHPTAPGTYTILTKNETYHSEKYDEASMPFMERLTWDGMAIHGGNNPGKPSSHGCIHVPLNFAKKLYDITQTGETVLISDLKEPPGDTVDPGLIPQQTTQPAPDPKSNVKVPRGGPAPKDVSPDATPIPTPTPMASPAASATPDGSSPVGSKP
ncbi:hypothetical protein BH09VER1_BH09VER1_31880 [soil metagenome]